MAENLSLQISCIVVASSEITIEVSAMITMDFCLDLGNSSFRPAAIFEPASR
jgi:hypothetical protein